MKESNRSTPAGHGMNLAERLRNDAQRLPAPEQPGLVAQVMQVVRGRPRRADSGRAEKSLAWIPWLMVGATATAAVIVAISVISITETSPVSTLARQANLPRIVEARVDPVLASREQDLAGELQRIRADLNSLGRMVSIRLESDSQ